MSILTVKTITMGLKAKKILASHSIKSRLIKIDASRSMNGCQYGIEFSEYEFHNAVNALKEAGMEYGVYKRK